MTRSFSEKIKSIFDKLCRNYFAKASFIFILSSVILKGFSLITTPIFTRLLSQEQYGEVTTLITYSSFIAAIIFLSVSSSIATARIHYNELSLKKYTANILLLGFGFSAIIVALIYLLRNQLCDWLQISSDMILPLIIFSIGTAVQDTVVAYLIASKMPKAKLVYSVSTTLLNLVLGLVFVLCLPYDKGDSRIWSIGLTYIIGTVVTTIYFLSSFGKDCIVNFKTSTKYAILYGTPLLLHVISGRFITLSGRAFIAALCSKTDVAIYSVVYSIGHLGNVFTQACNSAWSPWYFDRTKDNAQKMINKYANVYISALTMIFVVIILFAREILTIIAPPEYSDGEPLIGIVAIGVFFQLLYSFPVLYEQYSRQIKWQGVGTMLAACLSLTLNILLIRPIGITGAAMSSVISYIFLFVLHEIVARFVVKGYNIRFSVYIVSIITIIVCFVYSRFTANYILLRLLFLPLVIVGMGINVIKNLKKEG